MLSLSGVLVDEPVGCLEFEVQHGSLRAGSGNPLSKQVAKQDSSVELALEVPGLAGAVKPLHQAGMKPMDIRIVP